MFEQRYLNVDMRVMFNVPISEDFDIAEIPEDELEDIATDYFFNEMGYDDSDYLDFEFDTVDNLDFEFDI